MKLRTFLDASRIQQENRTLSHSIGISSSVYQIPLLSEIIRGRDNVVFLWYDIISVRKIRDNGMIYYERKL